MPQTNDPHEPAFPRDHRYLGHNGLTKREWFAGQALQGLMASEAAYGPVFQGVHSWIAAQAFVLADAMIEQGPK